MQSGGKLITSVGRRYPPRLRALIISIAAFVVQLAGYQIWAAATVTLDNPTGFFTNVASRLLKSELGLDLNHIQIYPTNQYTPAVHRLLQFTANIYDASTNRTFGMTDVTNGLGFPSVFRPFFTNTGGGGIFVCGYGEVTNSSQILAGLSWRDLNVPNDVARPWRSSDMVYGIPLVVGAKKGWPNFNEFAMQTHLQLIRKLQFMRTGADVGTPRVSVTNQMYMMSISNVCGVEAWNSYSNDFNRPLWIAAAADVMPLLTNENLTPLMGVLPAGSLMPTNSVTNVSSWVGFPFTQSGNWRGSFLVPLQGSLWILTNSEYSQLNPRFISPPTGQFENPSGFPAPHWWLRLITRVRYVVVDTESDRIIDYVNLGYAREPFDISYALMGSRDFSNTPYGLASPYQVLDEDQWITNHWDLGSMQQQNSDIFPTYGILNQINLCRGYLSPDPSQGWNNYAIDPQFGGDANAAIRFFQFQLGLGSSDGTYSRSNVFYAPFSPVGVINLNISWQANDPLVHYTVPDLTDALGNVTNVEVLHLYGPSPMSDLGGNAPLNPHYRPWGGNPGSSTDTVPPSRYNVALKDPAVSRSDYWDFPTNTDPSLTWLSQVHRGTPWQTFYLKSASVDPGLWQTWVGVNDPRLASVMHPTNDWFIGSLLTVLLNTNSPGALVSVNQPGSDSWRSVLDGINVLTNSGYWPNYDALVMSSNSPQATIIGAALAAARTSEPGSNFRDVGDIVATPELSLASPWLNTNVTGYFAIHDVAYEMIPAQLLPRLRPDSFGSITQNGGNVQIQFTGVDDWRYSVVASPDLVNWVPISTNLPSAGTFTIQEPASMGSRFYRSILQP